MQLVIRFRVDNKHNYYFSEVWKFRFLWHLRAVFKILKQYNFITQNALFSLLLDLFYCDRLVDQKICKFIPFWGGMIHNLLNPWGGKYITSPNNISTSFCKQATRVNKLISQMHYIDTAPSFQQIFKEIY